MQLVFQKDAFKKHGDKIDENMVRDLVGLPRLIYIDKITKNILNQNEQEAIININEVVRTRQRYR